MISLYRMTSQVFDDFAKRIHFLEASGIGGGGDIHVPPVSPQHRQSPLAPLSSSPLKEMGECVCVCVVRNLLYSYTSRYVYVPKNISPHDILLINIWLTQLFQIPSV